MLTTTKQQRATKATTIACGDWLVNPAYDRQPVPVHNGMALYSNNARKRQMSVNTARPSAGSNVITEATRPGKSGMSSKQAKRALKRLRAAQ